MEKGLAPLAAGKTPAGNRACFRAPGCFSL